jgi:hypothetical protein
MPFNLLTAIILAIILVLSVYFYRSSDFALPKRSASLFYLWLGDHLPISLSNLVRLCLSEWISFLLTIACYSGYAVSPTRCNDGVTLLQLSPSRTRLQRADLRDPGER